MPFPILGIKTRLLAYQVVTLRGRDVCPKLGRILMFGPCGTCPTAPCHSPFLRGSWRWGGLFSPLQVNPRRWYLSVPYGGVGAAEWVLDCLLRSLGSVYQWRSRPAAQPSWSRAFPSLAFAGARVKWDSLRKYPLCGVEVGPCLPCRIQVPPQREREFIPLMCAHLRVV